MAHTLDLWIGIDAESLPANVTGTAPSSNTFPIGVPRQIRNIRRIEWLGYQTMGAFTGASEGLIAHVRNLPMGSFMFIKNRYQGSTVTFTEVPNGLPLLHVNGSTESPCLYPVPIVLHQEAPDSPGVVVNMEQLSFFLSTTEGVVTPGDYG